VTIEYFEYPLYSELRVAGAVFVQDWLGTADVPPPRHSRLLIDYSGVESIDVSVGQLIAAAEALASAGIRFAFIAPHDPVVLALVRRVMILAHVTEGVDVALFAARPQALAWLLGGDEGSAALE
jgi:anti-anti-sigma regulatory factor